jgi:hypothetical protein
MNKLPTIEQRIAAALTSTDITSSDLAALIQAVEVAAQVADEDATKAREQALDPGVVVDTAKVGAAVATAELTRDRLQAALPRLRVRYKQVREQEDIAKWQAEAAPLQERRVVLGTKFGKDYPKLMNEVLHQLRDMWALDQEINALNRRRPDNAGALVELITPAFSKYLKIPDPALDAKRWEHESGYLWPPQQPNLTLQMLAAMRPDPFIISEAAKGTYIEARNRRVLEDNRRQIAEAEQRQREFEKQKAAEAEAAKERDRQAYRERGWPSG